MQTFTAPLNTTYKIECWGAQGGNSYNSDSGYNTNTKYGGKGGYCSGMITLPSNLNIYVYVGQSGEGISEMKTFNGGGASGRFYGCKSGGGATDVRLVGGTWSEFNSLKSRIIVAAGGAGGHYYLEGCDGGYAGGLVGGNGGWAINPVDGSYEYLVTTGAYQSSGGIGGTPTSRSGNRGYDGMFGICGELYDINLGSGSGGGYYCGGGGGVAWGMVGSGSGGSSFISGYSGCDAIAESSTEDNIIHTSQPNHYSGKIFTNSVMRDGGSVMPSPTGGTETGHTGNGYCIITWFPLSLEP